MKQKLRGKIISQKEIAKDIFDIEIEVGEMARQAKAGQFVSLYLDDKAKLLPRPISICEIKGDVLRLVYRVTKKGAGTEILSRLQAGETVSVLGSLGNGFPLDSKKTILIGGGIGIPPMLETMKKLEGERIALLGYRDASIFLNKEFEAYGDVYIATEDGSVGTKGNVMDILRQYDLKADRILACGPTPMLRAIKEYAMANNIECFISLEEKMACGIGACLACVCKTKEKDAHSHVHNTRICKDGPVFIAKEVEI